MQWKIIMSEIDQIPKWVTAHYEYNGGANLQNDTDTPVDGHYVDDVGDEIYVVNSRYHRTDGPAVILNDGSKEWLHYGLMHRADGPARIRPSGDIYWFYEGVHYEYDQYVKVAKWTSDQIIHFKLTGGL